MFDQVLFLDDDAMMPATADNLVHKKMAQTAAVAACTAAKDLLANLSDDQFNTDTLAPELRAIGEANTDNGKAGPFLGTARFAVTRQKVSPPLFESILALGRDRAIARLDAALAILAG